MCKSSVSALYKKTLVQIIHLLIFFFKFQSKEKKCHHSWNVRNSFLIFHIFFSLYIRSFNLVWNVWNVRDQCSTSSKRRQHSGRKFWLTWTGAVRAVRSVIGIDLIVETLIVRRRFVAGTHLTALTAVARRRNARPRSPLLHEKLFRRSRRRSVRDWAGLSWITEIGTRADELIRERCSCMSAHTTRCARVCEERDPRCETASGALGVAHSAFPFLVGWGEWVLWLVTGELASVAADLPANWGWRRN